MPLQLPACQHQLLLLSPLLSQPQLYQSAPAPVPILPNIQTCLQMPRSTLAHNCHFLNQLVVQVFLWGNHSAADFANILEATYSEVVHWRRNCFAVPFGKAGREFVDELSKLYLSFASASALESIALKAATVLPILRHKELPMPRSTLSVLRGD